MICPQHDIWLILGSVDREECQPHSWDHKLLGSPFLFHPSVTFWKIPLELRQDPSVRFQTFVCVSKRLLLETKAFFIRAPIPCGDRTLFSLQFRASVLSRWLYLPLKHVVHAFRGSHYLLPCFYCCLVLSRPSHCCKESGWWPGKQHIL